MTPARKIAVCGFLAAMVAIDVAVIARDREWWPFSSYPMFSELSLSRDTSALFVVGIDAAGAEHRLDVGVQFAPLNPVRLWAALVHLQGARRQVALAELYQLYERNRGGDPRWPLLTGLRLYEYSWTIQDDAANVGAPAKKLFAEWSKP